MIMRFLHFYFTYSPLSSPFSLSPQLNCSPSSSVSYKHSFPLLFASRISNAFIKINMMFYFYQGTSAYRCGQKINKNQLTSKSGFAELNNKVSFHRLEADGALK